MVDVNLTLGTMIILMVKWSIAGLIVALILGTLGALIGGMLMVIFAVLS